MLYSRKRTGLFIKTILFFIVALLSIQLRANNATVYLDQTSINSLSCTETNCYFPGVSLDDLEIHVKGRIDWDKSQNLVLHTKEDIVFEKDAKITVKGDSSIILKAGMEPGKKEIYTSTVEFQGNDTQIEMLGKGKVKIYYNSLKNETDNDGCKHKYCNPRVRPFYQHIKWSDKTDLHTYMLVNNVNDLQYIMVFLSKSYALSQNIDAAETKTWNKGEGFKPLKDNSKNMPFSGDFDGNGYFIDSLFMSRPTEEKVGLFGMCSGREDSHNIIENLELRNFSVAGDHYVGSLAGWVTYTDISNVKLNNFSVISNDISGGLIGTMYQSSIKPVIIIWDRTNTLEAHEYKGYVAGTANECSVVVFLFCNFQDQDKANQQAMLNENTYIGVKNRTDISDVIMQGNTEQILSSFLKLSPQYLNLLNK